MIIIYQRSPKFKYKAKIMQTPSSLTTTLIADLDEVAEFSTFLEDGNILLKSASRYMIFNSDGQFVDEVEFKDIK